MKVLKKYNNMSIQSKASIWFVMCSLLQKGISFITIPIFTRLMSTQQYGGYSLYMSWLSILTIVTSLYLYNGVFNNAMIKYENDRDRYISSMQGLTITITLSVLCILFIFHDKWKVFFGLSDILIAFMFAEMIVSPALNFWSGRQRFEYKYKKLVFVTLFISVMNPVVGLIFVANSDNKTVARVFSVVIVEFVICGIIMIKQFIKGKIFFKKIYWKFALKMAIPLMPHYLSGMVLNQGDRVMIDKMVGTAEVAYYSVAYNIGMIVQIVTQAINASLTPWLYGRIKEKNYDNISMKINNILILVGTADVGLMLLSPELILFFGSEKYLNAMYVIPPVAASVFFIFLYNVLAIPQFYFEKTNFLMISSIVAALINIALNFIFIKMYGFIAAGYTTLICYVLYSIGHYITSKQIINANAPEMEIFDKKVIIVIGVIMILAGSLSGLLFRFTYVRYSIIIAILVVVVIFHNKIINILHNTNSESSVR